MKRIAALVCAALALPAWAQNLKPGLWEITNRMSSESGKMESAMQQMQQQMAAMPPEQRKAMQDMMAKQGVAMGERGNSVRMCFTSEMVQRNELPAQQGDCRTTVQPRTGNTMKMSFTCASPPSSGEGQITFASPEAYSMKMAMTTSVQGRAEKMTMDAAGRWLGADCGAVRPVPQKR